MKFEKPRILITGATDGLGLRLAWLFAAQNAELLVTGRKAKGDLKHALPAKARYIVADQSDISCAGILKSEIEKLGWDHIDHIILNAGTGQIVDPVVEQPGSMSHVMAVNLITPVSLVHQLSSLFLTDGASKNPAQRALITFIGSTSAKGATNFASYAASKAGVSGFVRALASEWRHRVDVQIIHPGPTATGMHEKAGLEVGFARHFFVDPDYCASQIIELIDTRTPVATIGMGKYAVHRFLSKIGLKSKPETAVPQ